MLNFLNTIINLPSTNFVEGLNWLGRIVQWLVEIVPNVGLGIILFTLVLKVITLPLDVYSKASMRKNSLKMEKMRPQLEKLQKQYANDQKMYNAKMMEMYKKNGYSMLGACLPMIVTLVIFFFVLSAFSAYSNFTNVNIYVRMAENYNSTILTYVADTDAAPADVEYSTDDSRTYIRTEYYDGDGALIQVRIDRTMVFDREMTEEELAAADWSQAEVSSPTYYVKTESVLSSSDADVQAAADWARENSAEGADDDSVANLAVRRLGRNAAEATYREGSSSFLWIKNIWLPDTHYTHPLQQEEGVPDTVYNEITANLEAEKSAANGYYILIVISIGSMFLSQFITSRSQKAQNELQTADGSGKRTQRIMMIVMPIIFGIFSFMYSAAFSIYMITSNLFGILSTVVTNFFIDKKFARAEEREIQEKYNKRIPQAARKTDERNGGKKQ